MGESIFHRRKLKRNVSRNSIANGRATVSSRDFITPRANYARAIRVEEDAVAFVSTPTIFDPSGWTQTFPEKRKKNARAVFGFRVTHPERSQIRRRVLRSVLAEPAREHISRAMSETSASCSLVTHGASSSPFFVRRRMMVCGRKEEEAQ